MILNFRFRDLEIKQASWRDSSSLAGLLHWIGKTPALLMEVPLRRSRGEVMQDLAEAAGAQNGEGVRIQDRGGVVWLAPLSRRAALRVAVEAATLEDAEALCREYADRVRELDRQG